MKIFTKNEKLARGLCVPFVDISLRASFFSASHFSTEIRARKIAWPLKRNTVLYWLNKLILGIRSARIWQWLEANYFCCSKEGSWTVSINQWTSRTSRRWGFYTRISLAPTYKKFWLGIHTKPDWKHIKSNTVLEQY